MEGGGGSDALGVSKLCHNHLMLLHKNTSQQHFTATYIRRGQVCSGSVVSSDCQHAAAPEWRQDASAACRWNSSPGAEHKALCRHLVATISLSFTATGTVNMRRAIFFNLT